jgi:hypothetical protein
MDEKRKFNRWYPVTDFTTNVSGEGFNEKARVLDISAAGMKACLSQAPEIGSEVYGKLEIPYNSIAFFVKGEVTRIDRVAGIWETAIRFGKVSTIPFAGGTV